MAGVQVQTPASETQPSTTTQRLFPLVRWRLALRGAPLFSLVFLTFAVCCALFAPLLTVYDPIQNGWPICCNVLAPYPSRVSAMIHHLVPRPRRVSLPWKGKTIVCSSSSMACCWRKLGGFMSRSWRCVWCNYC